MKTRFLSLLMTVCLIFSCTLMLFSCGNGKENEPETPPEYESDGYLNYFLLDDGTYSVSLKEEYRQIDLGNGETAVGDSALELIGEELVLPDTFKGKAVTQIADCGFMGARLAKLTLPASITYIGKNAFYGTSFVEELKVPEGVRVIGDGAFDPSSPIQREIKLPLSVEYLGASAFGSNARVMYRGELEDFGGIKSVVWSAKDGGGYEVRYTETPYSPPSHEAWYLYWEDFSVAGLLSLDYSKYVTEGQIFAGLWKHTSAQDLSFAFSYTPFFDGKSYTYTESEVTVTDGDWQRLEDAEVAGALASLLNAEERSLFSQSASKEEFAAKLEAHYADLYSGKSIAFADGKMTTYQSGVPSSNPLPYVELNAEAYTKTADGYIELFSHISGKPYEDCKTAYSTVKHHYVLSE